MEFAMPVVIILLVFGCGLILAQVLLRRKHPYLAYLGIAILVLAAVPLFHSALRWIPLLITLAFIVLAMREAYRDTQGRMAQFQRESKEREEAFGEYMQEFVRQKRRPRNDGNAE